MGWKPGRWLAGAALALGAQGAVAQQPRLVVDLHQGAGPQVSGMTGTGGLVLDAVRFFGATDGHHGVELWRSDGTAAGTLLLRDIHPGAGSSAPGSLVAFGPGFCFVADDGATGRELWCSDATREGTRRVADIRPGQEGAVPTGLKVHAGQLYFSADDGTHGRELWVSDGTEAGTRLVRDLVPGSGSSRPQPLASLQRGLLFAAQDAAFNDVLMLTDGSAAGTLQVHPYAEPDGSAAATWAGRAWFMGRYGELWTSDGTEAGTDDIFLEALNPEPGNLVASSIGVLFADWNADETERVLWCLDNTSWPEQLAITAGPGWLEAGEISGRVFLTGGSGNTLWNASCAGGSGREIAGAGIGYGSVAGITYMGGNLYFRATSGGVGAELHRYRAGGAVELVADIRAGSASSTPSLLAAVGTQLLMAADNGVNGRELWRSAGGGAALLRNLAPDGGSSRPRLLGTVNGRVVFTAFREDVGRELFASDGSEAGTVLLADALPGAASGIGRMDSDHHAAVAFDGHLYYIAESPAEGEELWRTDGTPAGTGLVADLCPGSCSGMDHHVVPDSMVATETLLFFATAPDGSFEPRLWRSDGTAAGTFALDAGPQLPTGSNRPIAALGDLVLFAAEGASGGRELWASDGTPAGTALVRDIRSGSPDSDPDWLTRVGDWIYFVAEDAFGDRELWRSDGTPVRTQRVADIRPGSSGSHPHHLTAHDGLVWFGADDGSSGTELWRSDGTAAGTVQVLDIAAGAASAWPRALASTAAGLFFAADDGINGPEPWYTDGTPLGTRRPQSIYPGPRDRLRAAFGGDGTDLHRAGAQVPHQGGVADYAAPVELLDTGDGRAVFRGCDATFGCQLWITSLPAWLGTQRLTTFGMDGGAAPGHLTLLDGTLYFAANADGSGRELWALPLPPRPDGIFADGFEIRN